MHLATDINALITSLNAISGLPDVRLESDPAIVAEQSGLYLYEIDVELEHVGTRPTIATSALARLTFVLVQRLDDLPDGSTDVTALNELVKKFDSIEDKLIADALSTVTGEIERGNVQYTAADSGLGAMEFSVLLRAFQ